MSKALAITNLPHSDSNYSPITVQLLEEYVKEKKKNELLVEQEQELRNQLSLYTEKFEEFQKTLTRYSLFWEFVVGNYVIIFNSWILLGKHFHRSKVVINT